MRGVIVGVLVLVVVGYLGMQIGSMYRAKGDLEERVEHYLDFVDDPVATEVKHNLVRDARRFGIELAPEDIHVIYQDTEQLTLPQRMVKLAEYKNKQVGIGVHYHAHILGFPLRQEITRGKIKQIEVRQKAPVNQLPPDMGE